MSNSRSLKVDAIQLMIRIDNIVLQTFQILLSIDGIFKISQNIIVFNLIPNNSVRINMV